MSTKTVTFSKQVILHSQQHLRNAVLTIFLFVGWSSLVFAQTDDYTSAYIGYHLNNFEYSEKVWTELAQNGDMNSQYALGVMQLRGESANSSPQKAFKWFDMAAQQGHSTAMFNVGVALWEGSGVEQNRETALAWWEQAANKGDSGAQFNLGLAYYLGEEKQRNIEVAAKWIGLAEQQNHPEANRVLQAIMDENPSVAAKIVSQGTVSQSTNQNNAEIAAPELVETTAPESEHESEIVINEQEETPTSGAQTFWKTSITAELRSSPKKNAPVFTQLPVDTPVEILQTRGPWSKVTLPEGIKTWIYNKYLVTNADSGTISGTNVRVRPQASTDNTSSPPLGIYRNGDEVKVLNQYETWTQIRAPKYIGGWVLTKNLASYNDNEANREALWAKRVAEGL
ncbi:MAG: SH3 domain-containing protein [Gammaproteobacteria bacterium]|nr:SH3 domain-containing protein [Gammaproteobacteria bacterium]